MQELSNRVRSTHVPLVANDFSARETSYGNNLKQHTVMRPSVWVWMEHAILRTCRRTNPGPGHIGNPQPHLNFNAPVLINYVICIGVTISANFLVAHTGSVLISIRPDRDPQKYLNDRSSIGKEAKERT